TAWLQELQRRFPQLVRLEAIGRSHEGREIWLVTVCAASGGAPGDRPALWVDGNVHATELAASSACLYLLHALAEGYGSDPDITRCLDTRTFYVCPRLNPDGAEWALAEHPKLIRSSTRPYPYDEAPAQGLVSEDMDGDGRILTMRIPDPNGPWKVCPQEPRLLVRREPAETGGRYFRLMPEGRVEGYDGVSLAVAPPREGLDLNRNYPGHWRPEPDQKGAGPYPTSEPEVRAAVDFIVGHPNITGAVAFHTFSGVVLRPYSHQDDQALPAEDLWTYQKIGAKATELTGYPAISVFHEFRYHPKEVITGAFDDWMYEHLGVYAWTVELWSPQRQAGIRDYKYIDWFREHPLEDDLRLLHWNDEALDGRGYVDWYPYAHPQLGPVELGGWDYLYTFRNPPPALLEREVAPFAGWLVWHLLIAPRLEILEAGVIPVGKDVYRVRLVVHNTGWLPTCVTRHARDRRLVRGVVCEIHLPDGAGLVEGLRRVEGGQLEGRAYKPSAPSDWSADPTEDRTKVEWLVRAPPGAALRLTARHPRAGCAEVTVAVATD
ncbi:MAG: M14 family metallopeptidase, partial [Gammaproteobacteria bacterium]